jgi:hypothetical protein
MTDSLSQHCPNCEAQAAEIERLREEVEKWVFYTRQTMLMYKDIQLEERAKIVAWLHEAGYRQIAVAVEAGEHLK